MTSTLIYDPFFKATVAGYKPQSTSCLALKADFVTLFFWHNRILRLQTIPLANFYEVEAGYKLPTSPCLAQKSVFIIFTS